MVKYRFDVRQELRGYIEREIGNEMPEVYAQQLEDEGLSTRDYNVMNAETEVDDWGEVEQ